MKEAARVDGAALEVRGRVALFLQGHLLGELAHDRLGGEPREAGDGRQVAEHEHAWCEVGVHAAVAQKLIAQFVLDDTHGVGFGCVQERRVDAI